MSNPQADRVRDIAKLRTRSARTKKGQFLVEGPQAVREALKAHLKSPILDAVYVTEAAFDRHEDIAEPQRDFFFFFFFLSTTQHVCLI